jgi:hypothetical protein
MPAFRLRTRAEMAAAIAAPLSAYLNDHAASQPFRQWAQVRELRPSPRPYTVHYVGEWGAPAAPDYSYTLALKQHEVYIPLPPVRLWPRSVVDRRLLAP